MKRDRRRARNLALQALYEIDCAGHPATQVIARHIQENATLGDEAAGFLERMVLGTLESIPAFDRLIAECAPGGGWCLGTGNSVASYIPLANYVAMLEEGRAVGSYPVE